MVLARTLLGVILVRSSSAVDCPLSTNRVADDDPRIDYLTHRLEVAAAPPAMPNCSYYCMERFAGSRFW